MNHNVDLLPLVDEIVKEAQEMQGTWSIRYCKDLGQRLKFATSLQRDIFIHNLLLKAQEPSYDMNVKFKIAQLLSCMNSFFFKEINLSLMNDKQTLSDTINSITEGHRLSEPTKKLFSMLINLPTKRRITPMSSDFQGTRLEAMPRDNLDRRANTSNNRSCSLVMFPFQMIPAH